MNTENFGEKLIQTNARLLKQRYPYDDFVMSRLALHIMVGQLPNILNLRYNIFGNDLDLRIHGTVFSPSGTNKGSIFTYVNSICEALMNRGVHVKYKTMGKFTDSALVGMPNTKSEKREILDGEGNPIVDENGKPMKETVTIDDHTYGALHPMWGNSILAWSEGSQLLDVKNIQYNQDTMNILQQCMNSIGTPDNLVSKSTGLGEISFNTSCSVFMVTYRPRTLNEKVVSTGMLQRQIVIMREPTSNDSVNAGKNAINGLMQPKKQLESIDSLIDSLVKVNEFAGTITSDDLVVPDDVKTRLELRQLDYHQRIKYSNILVRQKLGEFVRRWSVNIFFNLMFHHAIMDLRKVVTVDDVEYAHSLLYPIWRDFAAFLEGALMMDKREMENVQKQYGYIVMVYRRLLRKNEERKAEMTEEQLEDWEEVDGYVRMDALVGQLAFDWAQSQQSVMQIIQLIGDDVFDYKEVLNVPPEDRPDKITKDWLDIAPKATWIKLKSGALRTINVK